MQRKKILYFITKGNWGGAQRYVFDLATSLPKDSFDIAVVLGEGNLLEQELRRSGIRVIKIPKLARAVGFLRDPMVFLRLFLLLRRERPDVIHLNSSKMGGIGALAARLAGVPKIIFTAHGWPFWENRNALEKYLITFFSFATLVLCHKTITITDKDRDAFRGWPWIRGKIENIPLGIQWRERLSKADARAFFAQNYRIPPSYAYLGTIAELHPNKDLSVLLEAFAKLPKRELSLIIIGEGEERSVLLHAAHRLGIANRVFLTGFIRDAAALLTAFDIFLLSSRKEGLPYALLEAGAAMLPVVAMLVGGIPDVIENGKTGLLVRSRDIAGFTDAIRRLLEQKEMREDLGKALKERVEKEFSFARMLAHTKRLYEKE